MNKIEILDLMIDYAILNWKYPFYESEREDARQDLTDGKEHFIENLLEDIEYNPARCEDAKKLLELVKTI